MGRVLDTVSQLSESELRYGEESITILGVFKLKSDSLSSKVSIRINKYK